MTRRASRLLPRLLALGLAAAALAVVPASTSAAPETPAPRAEEPAACDGVDYADVLGPRPSYGNRTLRTYPVRALTCAAYFLPSLDEGFVPQGIAVDGNTVYVSGYTYAAKAADQFCRLVWFDKRTGRWMGNIDRISARAGSSGRTLCRHGGGLEIDGDRIWMSERERLFLLDKRKLTGDPGIRMWRIHPPAYGSSLVIKRGQLGLLQFMRDKDGTLAWLRLTDVLRSGVTDIGATNTRTQAAPVKLKKVVPYAQGSTPLNDGGLLMTRTWNSCGQLVRPDRTLTGALPSIQDVELSGGEGRMWLVSERSAKPYTGASSALVPPVSLVDAQAALALTGHGSCP